MYPTKAGYYTYLLLHNIRILNSEPTIYRFRKIQNFLRNGNLIEKGVFRCLTISSKQF